MGTGSTAQVRRFGRYALKVAHPTPEARARLAEEVRLHRRLRAAGIPVARLVGARPAKGALLRQLLPGPSLAERLSQPLPKGEVAELFALWQRVQAFEEEAELRVDFTPANLYRQGGGYVLADAGRRGAAPVFRARSLRDFTRELERYPAWRARQRAAAKLQPLLLPPSGRYHVETPVGPAPAARVLWVNEGLQRRLALPWTARYLKAVGGLATFARPTTVLPATRYSDMVALDRRRGPRGDGRSVYLGTVETAVGRRELTLKGCGPTPLAWRGRRYHQDGFVSFPRALWEATVADELARLGFDTPEVLALVSNGATTLDNTRRRWPAAAAVRVCFTHFRLGHLRWWSNRPEAFFPLFTHVGRALGNPRFDARRPSQVCSFARRFADNLGHDAGRTDAMQIHCQSPTPGNVRLDGHFLDYSTVRFFRDYVPDYRLLEDTYPVRLHRLLFMRQTQVLADVLAEAGAVRGEAVAALRRSLRRRYQRRYEDGFLDGLARFFGFDSEAGSRTERRRAVRLTQALRELRGPGQCVFRFFQQRCEAPLFDVLGKAPRFVRRWTRRPQESWRAMLLDADAEVPARVKRLAERWVAAMVPLLSRPVAPPRRWNEVIRPGMEPERLAALCYGRSRMDGFGEWKRFIATSRHLPERTYGYRRARALALKLGHVELPGLREGSREVLVGVTPELLAALRRTLRRHLGERLVGVVAHGSRVMERRALRRVDPEAYRGGALKVGKKSGVREYGPGPSSSDLDLKVFIRPGLSREEKAQVERELGRALSRLGAWFPLCPGPLHRQRLLETRARHVREAFRRWNGPPRLRLLGKTPIPEAQALVLL